MLNPSTADGQFDDPTIRRCMKFTADWGYGGMHVVNLFALRATDPGELREAEDPIGPENDKTILSYAHWRIVAAWGAHGGYRDRDKAVLEMLKNSELQYFGLTKTGQPRHPLYIPGHYMPLFMPVPGNMGGR